MAAAAQEAADVATTDDRIETITDAIVDCRGDVAVDAGRTLGSPPGIRDAATSGAFATEAAEHRHRIRRLITIVAADYTICTQPSAKNKPPKVHHFAAFAAWQPDRRPRAPSGWWCRRTSSRTLLARWIPADLGLGVERTASSKGLRMLRLTR